jgi:gliding motility-associated-like protein
MQKIANLCGIVILLMMSFSVKASHIVGGEIVYKFISKDNSSNPYHYRITFNIYIDQFSQAVQNNPPGITYGIYNAGTKKLITQAFLSNPFNVPLIRPNLPPGCNVGSISSFGVFVYTFTADVNLPESPQGYNIIYQRCCRNSEIVNIFNPGGTGNTFFAYIGPPQYANNSPQFSEFALPSMCVKDTNTFVNNAYDVDGDRLEYRFVTPYTGGNQGNPAPTPPNDYPSVGIVTYGTGYSVSQPFGRTGFASISSTTGVTTFASPNTGNFIVAVQINEYRNLADTAEVLVGTVIRELQILVADCPVNKPPAYSSSNTTNTVYEIYAGQKLCFDVNITDAEGDSVFLAASGEILDGTNGYTGTKATFPNAASKRTLSSQFCWQTDCTTPGRDYFVTIKASDKGCPPKTNNIIYTLRVLGFKKQPKITGSSSVCPGVKGVDYVAEGRPGYTYQWKVTRGTLVSGQGGQAIKVDWPFSPPGVDGEVSVIVTSPYGCVSDEVKLKVKINKTLTPPAPEGEDTLCFYESKKVCDYNILYTTGSQYYWSIKGGKIISGGNGLNSVKVSWDTLGTGLLWVRETSVQTEICEGLSDTLRVIIHPSPDSTLLIQGNLIPCEFSTGSIYKLSGLPNSKYKWTITGGTITAGQNTNTITVTWGKTGKGQLTVLETSEFGCVGRTIVASPTISPLPIPSISVNNFNICPQNLAGRTYTATGFPNSTFNWIVTGGNITAGQGTATVTINWLPGNIIRTLQVTETTDKGCSGNAVNVPLYYDPSSLSIRYVTIQPGIGQDSIISLEYLMESVSSFPITNRVSINRRKLDDSNWQTIKNDLLRTGTNFTDSPLPTSTTIFEYKVSGVNACGFTIESLPHNSILLTGQGDDSSAITLSWNNYKNWTNGVKEYQIWRKLDRSASFELYATVSGNTFQFTAKNAKDGFLHAYKIKAIEQGGTGFSWSNTAFIEFRHKLLVYNLVTPNADTDNDRWYIKNIELFPENEVVIYNRWGREVYRKSNYNNDFTAQDFSNGTYFYSLNVKTYDFTNTESRITGKFNPVTEQYRGWLTIMKSH